MSRTEHYRDQNAPEANSLVVAAVAFVQDDGGRVLLVQRSDNGMWALPGGAMNVGEHIGDAAERETLEETGVRVRITGLVGVYSDPEHVMAYDDGEVRQQFALCFRAERFGGALTTSSESPRVGWFNREQISELYVHPSIQLRIDHGFDRAMGDVYLG